MSVQTVTFCFFRAGIDTSLLLSVGTWFSRGWFASLEVLAVVNVLCAADEFHDEVELRRGGEDLVQADDVAVGYGAHGGYLALASAEALLARMDDFSSILTAYSRPVSLCVPRRTVPTLSSPIVAPRRYCTRRGRRAAETAKNVSSCATWRARG